MSMKEIGCLEAAERLTHTSHSTVAPTQLQQTATPQRVIDAQAGKWLAMMLYNGGLRSLSDTESDFASHPEWSPA